MGLVDFFKKTFGIGKQKKALSLIFHSSLTNFSIYFSRKGQDAIEMINSFAGKCTDKEAFQAKNPEMAAAAAERLFSAIYSKFLGSEELKQKLFDLNVAVETKVDAGFYANLEKTIKSIRISALKIPDMFRNPVSFKNKTGVVACQNVAEKIKDLMDALDAFEKKFVEMGK